MLHASDGLFRIPKRGVRSANIPLLEIYGGPHFRDGLGKSHPFSIDSRGAAYEYVGSHSGHEIGPFIADASVNADEDVLAAVGVEESAHSGDFVHDPVHHLSTCGSWVHKHQGDRVKHVKILLDGFHIGLRVDRKAEKPSCLMNLGCQRAVIFLDLDVGTLCRLCGPGTCSL